MKVHPTASSAAMSYGGAIFNVTSQRDSATRTPCLSKAAQVDILQVRKATWEETPQASEVAWEESVTLPSWAIVGASPSLRGRNTSATPNKSHTASRLQWALKVWAERGTKQLPRFAISSD